MRYINLLTYLLAYLMELRLTATQFHLPYEITQCYLPPDTSEHNTP